MQTMKNDMSREQELEHCSFIKTALMLLVILGHSVHFWTDDWFAAYEPVFESNTLRYISNFISGFHIYAFTLVSGYIYRYQRIERKRYEHFGQFVMKKVKRLLVPYLFAAAVWVVPMHEYFYGFDLKIIIGDYVLAMAPSQLWFLLMLFWVFMIVWPLSDVLERIGRGGYSFRWHFMGAE